MMALKILLRKIWTEIILNSKKIFKILENLIMMRVYFWMATKFKMKDLLQIWLELMYKSNIFCQVDKKMNKKQRRLKPNLKENTNFNYCQT